MERASENNISVSAKDMLGRNVEKAKETGIERRSLKGPRAVF